MFRLQFKIHKKVCSVIIDSGSYENLIASLVIRILQRATTAHVNIYRIRWIKKGKETIVSKTCQVPFSISKSYQDNVVDIDACYILLDRPWQFDLNVQTMDERIVIHLIGIA